MMEYPFYIIKKDMSTRGEDHYAHSASLRSSRMREELKHAMDRASGGTILHYIVTEISPEGKADSWASVQEGKAFLAFVRTPQGGKTYVLAVVSYGERDAHPVFILGVSVGKPYVDDSCDIWREELAMGIVSE